MEFKFRAVDDTPAPAPTPTSFPTTVTYISNHSLRGMIPSPRHNSFPMPMNYANETLRRELEKEQIRREIIAGEIERRRELEEEVRRELALERCWGMTMTATSHGFSFEERVSTMRSTPSPYLFDNNARPQPQLPQLMPPAELKPSPETNNDKVSKLGSVKFSSPSPYRLDTNAWPQSQLQQLTAPAEELKLSSETNNDKVLKLGSVKFSSPHRYRFDNNAWPQPQLEQLMAPVEEFKPSQETNNDKVVNLELMAPAEFKPSPEIDKDKVIKLAKPDPDRYDAKRKAVTTPDVDGSDHFPAHLKKKTKEEWSCAVCQVSATSEKGLKDHLQGRKHKAKEIALRKQIVKSTNTSLSSKKSEKSVKSMETATSGLDAKAYRTPVQSSITWGDISQTMADKGAVKSNNEERSVHKIVKSNEPVDTTTSGLDAKANRPPRQSSITWGDINQKMAGKGAVQSKNEEQLVQKNVKSNEPGDTTTSGLDAKADRLPFQPTFLTWGNINKTMANKGALKSNDEEQLLHKNVNSNEPTDTTALRLDAKIDKPTLQPSFIPWGDITKTMANKSAVESKNKEQQVQKNQNIDGLKNENGTANEKGGMNAPKRKRMKFWCETCQVGALSQVVMESHKKGKKHLARMKTSSVSVEAPGLIKDTDAGNKETIIKMVNSLADSD